MNIEAFILCFNESETLHLTIKHYQSFCSKITIFDNFSTDNSREIAEAMGCEVRLFGVEGQLNDAEYLKVKNNAWKGSQADWVIVCDADEILWHPNLTQSLFNCKMNALTIVSTDGINMFSDTLPSINWMEVKTGVPDKNYSKFICFDPKAISEIGYVYGCHESKPTGNVRYSSEIGFNPYLLHYKHVGGAERIANRHALYASRLSAINKRWKLGFQYSEPRAQTIKYFNEQLALAKAIF